MHLIDKIITALIVIALICLTVYSLKEKRLKNKLIKMKRKELLRLILKELSSRSHFYGICEIMSDLLLHLKFKGEEYIFIEKYVKSEKPKYGDIFYSHSRTGFWWPLSEEGKKTRIKFLNHLIHKNS